MKKLLISLTILFSIFLFSNRVLAATSNSSIYQYNFENFSLSYNGITYNQENIYSKIETYLSDNTNYTMSDFGYIFIGYAGSRTTATNDVRGFIYISLRSEDFNPTRFTASSTAWGRWEVNSSSSKSINLKIRFSDGNIVNDNISSNMIGPMMSANSSGFYVYTNFNINTSMLINNSNYSDYMRIYIDNSMLGEKSYNVTFHLNGGIVEDSSDKNTKGQILNQMCQISNCMQYNSYKTNPYKKMLDNINMSKIYTFLNDYPTSNNSKFISLGMKLVYNNYVDSTYYYDDYTIEISKSGLSDYLTNVEFTKENMQFSGLYYDSKLTIPVNKNDELSEDCDFYVKWVYKNVEDFLANTTFTTYTFDTNYEYAIISLNNSENRDIYLGLNYLDYSLEVYKYLKNSNSYIRGASLCLTPYYSKDNKYYYWLQSPLDNDYEVLIIPKEKFKDSNYEFLLSNNAYVSYTNDLTSVVIKDDDGNDLTTDLSSSYNYSQDLLINSENDVLEIFKDLGNNKNNNVFQYINQVWNLFKQSPLFTYFNMLIIGSIIILIVRAAKRH